MHFNIYDFTSFTQSIDKKLNELMSPSWALLSEFILVGLVILTFYAIIGLYLVYAERKVCAFMQNRIGTKQGREVGFAADNS